MMQALHLNMKVTVPKDEVLTTLRKNKEEHELIYKEAVAGFKDHAKAKLNAVLKRCTGTEDISMRLAAPQNFSSAYTTVIKALELDKKDDVVLTMSEFRCLMEDEWDWMGSFLLSNQLYSATATRKLGD